MDELNKKLKRQIWKHLGDESLEGELHELLTSISATYDNYDKELSLLNRIMDLSSKELFSANKELRKRNEELDRFVYSTSHDLRAPLTSILGLLQIIELSDNPKEKEHYLDQIKFSTIQLDNFIQDIVHYTHNKKMQVADEEINPKQFIQECIEKLNFMTNAPLIKKEITIESTTTFYSDPQRFRNLISNLISNSIKYYNPAAESPFIDIHFSVSSEEAVITVEDNGIGIAEPHLPRIFDMFYRASATSKGSGIGLYIVKEIVGKLNGEVSVSSVLGEGSSFRIAFPNKNAMSERNPSKKS